MRHVDQHRPRRAGPSHPWRIAVGLVAVLAFVGGCGSKDANDSTGSASATSAPPTTVAPATTATAAVTTTARPTTTVAGPVITLEALAARFACSDVTPDPQPRPDALESGTCTRAGTTYEIATFAPGTVVIAMDHPDLCAHGVETIITSADPTGPQWEVAPARKIDVNGLDEVLTALDGQMTIVTC